MPKKRPSSRRSRSQDPILSELSEKQRSMDREYQALIDLPERLERERSEADRMIPPFPELYDRQRQAQHEATLSSRGEVRNHRLAQGRSLVLFVMFAAATTALVSWGLKLLQG